MTDASKEQKLVDALEAVKILIIEASDPRTRHELLTAAIVKIDRATAFSSEELVADMTRVLPGGGKDDSSFSAIEDALDMADAPMIIDGKWLTLVERIAALSNPLPRVSDEPERCIICNGRTFAKIDGEQAHRCVECKTVIATLPEPSSSILVDALKMARNSIGDLKKGFSPSVEPARWVEQLQAYIDAALAQHRSK